METKIRPGLEALSLSFFLGMSLLISACGSSSSNEAPEIDDADSISGAAARISQASSDDYNDNRHGVVTGLTVGRWLEEWTPDTEAGPEGRLVLLQMAPGPAGSRYLDSSNPDVSVYRVDGSDFSMTRGNEVIETLSMVLEGQAIDRLLTRFDIDPTRDTVVCAPGDSGSLQNVLNAGRCWFTLRYWGMPAERLAVMNGGNQVQRTLGMMQDRHFAADPTSEPQTVPEPRSVKALQENNFALLATLQDMVSLVDGDRVPEDGYLLWDSRDEPEFFGVSFSSPPMGLSVPGDTCAGPDGAFRSGDDRCALALEGALHGAAHGQFLDLFRPDGRFRPKSELAAYIDGLGYEEGQVVYHYSWNGLRTMGPMLATATILGLPTKVYDGGSAQWNSLAFHLNVLDSFNLPSDSPWRNDLPNRTSFLTFNPSNSVEPAIIANPYATSARGILDEDRRYRSFPNP